MTVMLSLLEYDSMLYGVEGVSWQSVLDECRADVGDVCGEGSIRWTR